MTKRKSKAIITTTATDNTRTTSYLPWSTAQNLVKLLQADGYHNTALMCAAGFYLGLRIGDILQLRWEHLQAERFYITEQKTAKTRKKNKPRAVNLHPDFKAVVKKALAAIPAHRRPTPQDYVFVSQEPRGERYQPITVQAAIKRFKKALDRYGIETANASTHTLRKTFGRRVWENDGSTEAALFKLQEVFGHSSIQITKRYLGITQDEIAEVYLNL